METYQRRVTTTTIVVAGLIALAVDTLQIYFDAIVIGAFTNGLISTTAIGIWYFFLNSRQIPITGNSKRFISQIITFIGEEIPYGDVFPFWTIDVVYTLYTAKKEDDQLEKEALEQQIIAEVALKEQQRLQLEHLDQAETEENHYTNPDQDFGADISPDQEEVETE